ncbi:MAG TPA: HPr family phosphocarrier protein [Ktedonobacteraceae bacterium]|jgi:phosphocarrier protein|nr:HPr family phosphocarrier protein [Ktedonobacteraceae bacterium]
MAQVAERTVTLQSSSGLHARPATLVVQQAKGFTSKITLLKGEKTANAKSLLSILALGAEQGDSVVLKAEGEDAETAIEKLSAMLERDLG